MSLENQDELMRQCVDYYYNRELSQAEIAKRLFISRSSVCRLLKMAKEKKIVRVSINEKIIARCPVLEKTFMNLFGLENAIITFDSEDTERTGQVSKATAQYLDSLLHDGTVIAISRGNTLRNVVKALKGDRKAKISVVQLVGLMNNPEKNDDEMELAKIFADAYGGSYYNLYSPFMIEDKKIREIFNQYAAVGKTLEMVEKADVVLISIGSYSADDKHIISNSYLSETERRELVDKGAIGLICGNYYDVNGNIIETSLDDNVIGLEFNKIINKNVIGVAYGKEKALPVLGALRGHFLKTLVIDQMTALNILIENGVTIDF